MASKPDPEKSIKAHQSEVARAGKAWEVYVAERLSSQLSRIRQEGPHHTPSQDLHILSLAESGRIKRLREENRKLYDSLVIHIYQRDLELIGDTDIVLYSERHAYPVVIVSCKLSLHGRLTESLFYSLYYRLTRKIRYVLATPDKGKQSSHARWESEWGSESSPTKDRILASVFLDGVYVENEAAFLPKAFRTGEDRTVYGGIVRPLDRLLPDTLRWYDELFG